MSDPPERRPEEAPSGSTEEAHDVLAADEFSIGTRDDRYPGDPTGITRPHDVLAAEEFAMPTRDDRYPRDPSGIEGPHDVLAAEEFAMPTGGGAPPAPRSRPNPRALIPLLALAILALLLLLRRR